MAEVFLDGTGIYCPNCGGQSRIYFERIPDSGHQYKDVDDVVSCEFLPPLKDCHCKNCDQRWFMFPEEKP